ncbi:hypothetical protein ES703_82525 [subsurface metagenome]
MLERIWFTTRVLGPIAAYRLEKRQITQTLRSGSNTIIRSIINGRVSAGDRLEIVLDREIIGVVEFISMDVINWIGLGIDDANKGGFDTLDDLEQALKRAGYRFKPISQYDYYRIQFKWLKE